MTGAPKPPNFGAMVDAWNDPETFAWLCNDYYQSLVHEPIDFTEPRRPKEGS